MVRNKPLGPRPSVRSQNLSSLPLAQLQALGKGDWKGDGKGGGATWGHAPWWSSHYAQPIDDGRSWSDGWWYNANSGNWEWWAGFNRR